MRSNTAKESCYRRFRAGGENRVSRGGILLLVFAVAVPVGSVGAVDANVTILDNNDVGAIRSGAGGGRRAADRRTARMRSTDASRARLPLRHGSQPVATVFTFGG